jgi:hypothetical protein
LRSISTPIMPDFGTRIFFTVVSTVLRLPMYDTQRCAEILRVRRETHALIAEPFLTRWVSDMGLLARNIRRLRSPQVAAERIHEFL